MLDTEVTKSNITAALVDAAGTKAKCRGWSIGTLGFTSTSRNNRKAFLPPIPLEEIVSHHQFTKFRLLFRAAHLRLSFGDMMDSIFQDIQGHFDQLYIYVVHEVLV